jgi:hypothetical protein
MFAGERRRTRRLLLAAAALGAMAAGCFRSTAPHGWLPAAEEASYQAFGSWIRIEDRSRRPVAVTEGELIAVDRDTIHVHSFGRLVSLSRASVCCVTLTAFHLDYSLVAAWAALGTLSAVSHGFGLILTAPIWMLAGTGAASAASRAPRIQSTDPDVLRRFARFPHGIPPSLDRATLRPKSWPAVPQPQRQLR